MVDSRIDLNSDVGEGFDGDECILSVVTSANVACGVHAGDDATMARTVALAAAGGVAIGAHASYPDREGFGRRPMDLAPAELTECVIAQVRALAAICVDAGTSLAYLKCHGALYSRIAADPAQAAAVVTAMVTVDRGLSLLTLPHGAAVDAARAAGVLPVAEGYADRAYTTAGTLVARSRPDAVIDDAGAVVARAVALATTGAVEAIDGTKVRVAPRSICIHGDTTGAAELSRRIREGLTGAGVALEAFSRPGPRRR